MSDALMSIETLARLGLVSDYLVQEGDDASGFLVPASSEVADLRLTFTGKALLTACKV